MPRPFRLARKVFRGLKAIHDEARHPGSPPPHQSAENPFHAGPHQEPREGPRPPSQPQAPAADDSEDKPWYLDGEEAYGWENTNAKEE